MAEDRSTIDARQRGFTLTEMMVALAILMFGLTAIAGSMTTGVSERRGSEMRFQAIHMVDRVFHDLQEDYFLQFDRDARLPPAVAWEVPGYRGMKYTAKFIEDPDNPRVVLARVSISWLEQGEGVAEVFERIMIRETPFSRRISQLKGSTK